MIKLKYSMLFILTGNQDRISIAQQKTTADTWQFHSINSIGSAGRSGWFCISDYKPSMAHSTNPGLAVLALDWTITGTGPIPFFIDLRKEFGKTVNKLFAVF